MHEIQDSCLWHEVHIKNKLEIIKKYNQALREKVTRTLVRVSILQLKQVTVQVKKCFKKYTFFK